MRTTQQAAGTTGSRGPVVPGYGQRSGSTVVLDRDGAGEPSVRRTVLPGGLRVLTEPVPSARSAAVGIWVGVGSRDEGPTVAGAAHYLEHLLFKGTTRRGAAQIAAEMDAVGGELNAYTTREHTCFYAHVVDADLPLAIDLLCDVVFRAVCAEADVDTERQVVLEEIAMRDDSPEDVLAEAFTVALLGEHPLSRPVLGTAASVGGLSRSALHGFWRRRYRLPKMVLAAAGNVEHRAVLRLVRAGLRDRLGGSAAPAAPRAGRLRLPSAPRLVLNTDDTEQAHLMLGMRALSRHDEGRYALSVLNTALGGGMSSRLFQEVRERRGLAYQVYSSLSYSADTGSIAVHAGVRPDHLGEAHAVIRGVLADVARDGLTDAELARAKGQRRGELVLATEDVWERTAWLGEGELEYGDYRSVAETLAGIDAVTGAQVAELAATVLRRDLAVSVVGPYAHADDLPDEFPEVIT